ncbi:hypothetical protein [Acidithiobacillus ferriphilus]|uniref:hypothetical protein n=1 Tax=Acidithiobacillus ferriphilus TaxID=1689834 RepID=UPI001D008C67|nr:hypothetical protein [Acidithiobacillus ferriphilus]
MVFHAGLSTWLRLEWLSFIALPITNYLLNPLTLEGAVLPTLISTGLLLKYWRQVKDQRIIIGFLFFAVTMGLFMQYWGITGLHLFTGGFVIWPVLVLLLGDRFPWPLAYPLTFIGTLIPDLYGAGMAANWSSGWFFGVGGAGFQDGVFLVPLETLIAAAVLNRFGILMRRRGYFSRRVNVDKDAYPEDEDRRAP